MKKEVETKLGIEKINPDPDKPLKIKDFKPHYVEAVNPHYIVNGNNIGIKILPEGKSIFPVIEENGAKLPSPDYWLSKYELPAMLFYTYLRKYNKNKEVCKQSVSEILKNAVRKQKTSSPEDQSVLMKRRIEREIIWCDTKLNEIGNVQKKDVTFGKKTYKTLKAGRIADILTRDMLYLQPSLADVKGYGKVTGANFQALQRSIAYYGEYRNGLNDIFIRAGLLNSNNKHPFLEKIDPQDYSSLIAFYGSYLHRRKTYFEEQKGKVVKGKKNFQCYPLRDLQVEYKKEIRTDAPVFLPRGLFDKAIKECLQKSSLNKIVTSDRANVAYLIQQYFKEICKDDVPEFYTQPRNYRLFEKEKDIINPPKKYLTLEERSTELMRLKPKKIPPSKANEVLEKEDHLKRQAI